jgi:soluble lytic murein transglycosylase-like protein
MTTRFDAIISRYAAQYGVPFTWVKAIVGTESSFRPDAVREEPRIGDRSVGLMQLLERTARALGWAPEEGPLTDPDVNIRYGVRLLADLIQRHGSNFDRVYSAYNSGRPDAYLTSAQVRRHVERARAWLGRVIEAAEEQKKTSSSSVSPSV